VAEVVWNIFFLTSKEGQVELMSLGLFDFGLKEIDKTSIRMFIINDSHIKKKKKSLL
jgi:hypothetical protein